MRDETLRRGPLFRGSHDAGLSARDEVRGPAVVGGQYRWSGPLPQRGQDALEDTGRSPALRLSDQRRIQPHQLHEGLAKVSCGIGGR